MSQLGQILTSGFVSAVPLTQTTASAGGGGGDAAVTAASTNSAATRNGRNKNSTSIFFDVEGPFTPPEFGQANKSLVAILIELPKQLQLDPQNPYQSSFQCGQVQCGQDLGFVKDTATFQGDNGNLRGICAPAEDCFLVDLNPGFMDPDFVEFSIGIRSHGAPITIDQLTAGAKITYVFDDGYQTTSALKLCDFSSQVVCASPQTPDLTVASQIVNPDTFQGSGRTPPCTPLPGSGGVCPDVAQTGVSDADPTHEGGQLSP